MIPQTSSRANDIPFIIPPHLPHLMYKLLLGLVGLVGLAGPEGGKEGRKEGIIDINQHKALQRTYFN